MKRTHDDDLAGHEVRRRYLLALRYVGGKCVLDVICGHGEGAAMLARRAALVIGADTDRAALAHACRRHPRTNAIFLQTDGGSFPVRPGGVDIVVWLRMHDPRTSRVPSLPAMKSVLAADGLMIIALPTAGAGGTDERERQCREFLGVLRRTFRHVLVLEKSGTAGWTSAKSTHDAVASHDRTDRPSTPAASAMRRDAARIAPRALRPHAAVTLCSDAPLPPIMPAFAAGDTGLSRAKVARRGIRRQGRDLSAAPRAGAPAEGARGLGADLVARRRDTLEEAAQIEMLEQHIKTLEQRTRDLRDMLLSAHEQLLQRDDEIQSLQGNDAVVRWQPTNQVRSPGERRAGRTARDELVSPPQSERTAQAEYIAMLERTIATKDTHIARIEARIAELQSHVDRLGQGPLGRIYRVVRRIAQYLHRSP